MGVDSPALDLDRQTREDMDLLKRGVIMNLTSQGLSKFVVLKDTGD